MPAYRASAVAVGNALARAGSTLVYGGGKLGLMGAVADAALEAEGRVIGVIPETLVEREHAHRGLTELHVVGSMHERKAKMTALSDGFVVLPGGIGTLDELAEALTWTQLGLIDRPIGLFNLGGYFDHLLDWLTAGSEAGFVPKASRDRLIVDDEPDRLVDRVLA